VVDNKNSHLLWDRAKLLKNEMRIDKKRPKWSFGSWKIQIPKEKGTLIMIGCKPNFEFWHIFLIANFFHTHFIRI
jgi:hypothetical protein